ncbi:MAG: hypothetical protein HYR67_07915 [Bacteroidetes bacterium]|nr:hypothetical protein [Bacteroidota bacterium]
MKNTVFSLLLSCILIWSCTINDKDFQIKSVQSNPTLVAPLASGNLSILDLLKHQDSAHIKIKSDGLVYLSYDQTLDTRDIRNLVTIPTLGNLTTPVSVPAGTYPANPNDYSSTSINRTVDMGIDEKLTEIAFKSGTLSYNMNLVPANSNFLYAVVLSIPEFTSNSTGAGLSQEVSGSGSIALSGYTFKNAMVNKFTLQLTLVVKKNPSPTIIPPGTQLNVAVSMAGMDFTYIRGFFGDQVVSPPAQTIDVQAFGTTFQKGASVSFAQPTINLTVVSDYGVPLTVTFAKLEARKQAGASLTMQTSPSSPIPITAPATLGTSASTSVSITNVKEVIDFAPTQFYYKVSGHINTGLTTGDNFMADTSQMRVKLHVEIPIYGKASNIILADTMDIGLSDVDQAKIDSASLKANVTNELPLDATLQFILTDAKYVFIDSLLTSSQTGIIKGSTVDSNGDLKSPGIFNQLIKLQQDKISKIFKAKKVIIRAKINTSKDAGGAAVDVKFKSKYKIDVKLGLRATLKVNATF